MAGDREVAGHFLWYMRGIAVIEIDGMLETFARGFCFTRSFTHPYVAERLDGMWVVRDGPRKSGEYRGEEYIVHGKEARVVDRAARKHARGRFSICALCVEGEEDGAMREAYKGLGYRLQVTEAMMVHPLRRVGGVGAAKSPARVERVKTLEAAERLAKAAGSRQILEEHLNDGAALRQYIAMMDEEIVGWVRSILVGERSWCSNMYVKAAYRRRGIARAMLSRMLREDRERGAKAAVLSASHTGARLYPVVGYERVGTLYVFKPRR